MSPICRLCRMQKSFQEEDTKTTKTAEPSTIAVACYISGLVESDLFEIEERFTCDYHVGVIVGYRAELVRDAVEMGLARKTPPGPMAHVEVDSEPSVPPTSSDKALN